MEKDDMGNYENGLPALRRIAAVHDISGFGKCSLTVALPIISAAGVECACMPTALLSTHTGGFTGYTFTDLSSEMLPIAKHWKKEGIAFDGVYSGYLASPEQGELLKGVFAEIVTSKTLVIIDPVMADHGEHYPGFDDRMTQTFRDLCPSADVIIPNITEASFMTGIPYMEPPYTVEHIDRLMAALFELGPKAVALTGVQFAEDEVGVAARLAGERESAYSFQKLREGHFHGSGDVFGSAFAALLVRGASIKSVIEASTEFVCASIDRTKTRGTPMHYGIDFEGALPGFMKRVCEVFNREI